MQARIRASERLLERLEGIKTAVEKRAEIAEQPAQVAKKRLSEIGARIRQLRAS
jgi:hypothetical protein